MRNWLSNEFTITKRLLGIMMILAGLAGLFAVVAVDFIRGGEFGPTQQLVLGIVMLTLIIGASLLPLGNRPA